MFFLGDGSGVSRSVPPDALLMVIQRDAEGDTERRSLIQEKRHRYKGIQRDASRYGRTVPEKIVFK